MQYIPVTLDISALLAIVTLPPHSDSDSHRERIADDLRDAFRAVAESDDVRVVVLAGSFQRPAYLPSDGFENLERFRLASTVGACDKPVIAAIEGDAIDQGLELALACDIRVSSSVSSFGLTHLEHGLMPWDGGTQRLPRTVGPAMALDMMLTSRLVDSDEALDSGLVHEIVESGSVLARAKEIATTVANHGPIAARYLKEAVLKGMDSTLEQGLRLEADLNFILQSTSDRAEGIGSFLNRRDPDFRGE